MNAAAGQRAIRRIMWWLTALAIVAGGLSTLSYGSGAEIGVRYFAPGFGAWWNAHEFQIMELSAAALGLLVAIRGGARFTEPEDMRRRASVAALIAAVLIAWPLTAVTASLARIGWDAGGASIRDFNIALVGYGGGILLDKILIAAVYFLKGAGFALLTGLALYAVVLVVMQVSDRTQAAESARQEEAFK